MAEELDPRTMTQGDLPDPEPPLQVTIRQVSATRVEATWLPQGDADLFRAELLDEDDAAILAADGSPVYADIAATFVRLTVPYAGTLQRAVKVKVSPLHPNGTVYDGTTSDAITVTTQFDGSYVSEISADKITSGSITSNIVIGGRIIAGNDPDASTGGYVEMKGTGLEWVPSGQTNPSVVLPSVGDASFTGVSVTASKGLDATGVTMRGSSTIADNATVTMSEGTVADPTAQATAASIWPSTFALSFRQPGWRGLAYDSATSGWWMAQASALQPFDSAGAAQTPLSLTSTWTVTSTATTDSLRGISYSAAEDAWIAVGQNGLILSSSDGATWVARTSGVTNNLNAVERSESDDIWVVVGDSGKILSSTDGTTWTSRTSGTSNALLGVARSDGADLWVAVGGGGTILTSSNGTSWTARTSGTTNTLRGIAYSAAEGKWIAVGDAGTVLNSSNGTSWTVQTSLTTEQFLTAARSEEQDLWVIAGTGGKIFTSPNGSTWTSRWSGTTQWLIDVAYSDAQDLWTAVCSNGLILNSNDGLIWSRGNSATNQYIRAIAWSGTESLWVGVCDQGLIITSPDAGIGLTNVTGIAVGVGDASTSRGFVMSNGLLRRFDKSTGAKLQDQNVSAYSSRAIRSSLFYDNSKIKVVTQDASGTGGKVQLVAYDPANLSTAPTTQTLDSSFTGNFSFYGAARFTAGTTDYYAIALTDSTRSGVYCFNATSGSRAATYDFYDSQGNVPDGGMAYDGTRFHTLATPNAAALQKHSTFHPGAATQNTYVRYSYANASYETRVSPAANIALAARAYLSIVLPDIPGGATKVRVYVRGAASDSTGANTYLKISSGDENLQRYTYGDADYTTGLNINAGSLGPWSGSDATPATFKSGAAGWELTGDGLVLLTEKSGDPSAPSSNRAVLFLKDNGSGKTQLCVRFSSGATQVIATQP